MMLPNHHCKLQASYRTELLHELMPVLPLFLLVLLLLVLVYSQMIHYVNKDGRVNAFYSTPSRYLAAKRATPGLTLPLKTDDFFPYCGNADGSDYWTGYFTSRPTLKAQVSICCCFLN
jgi:hypothetical protein